MLTALRLACETTPDLAATMQLQIPALAWHMTGADVWQRTFHLHGQGIRVQVEADRGGLQFSFRTSTEELLRDLLTATFRNGEQVGAMALAGHPALSALRRHHQGMILLAGSPFETLVLAILAQARPAEAVRKVFPRLAAECGGLTPRRLSALPLPRLTQLVRPLGAVKASRLHATAAILTRRGATAFDRLIGGSDSHALNNLLPSLPGVGTRTAAIVMAILNDVPGTVPIDQHLMRVAYRLGLTDHDGGLTKPGSRRVAADLLAYGPDVARVHPLLQQVAYDTCTVSTPDCRRCFLAESCRHAARNA